MWAVSALAADSADFHSAEEVMESSDSMVVKGGCFGIQPMIGGMKRIMMRGETTAIGPRVTVRSGVPPPLEEPGVNDEPRPCVHGLRSREVVEACH